MTFLPVVIGIEAPDGARVDTRRTDGSYGPIVLQLGTGLTYTSAFDGTVSRVTISAASGGDATSLTGDFGSATDSQATIGFIAVALGNIKQGIPTLGRALELQALLATTDAAVGATIDFLCHNTGLVVGTLTSLDVGTPGAKSLDVSASVGAGLALLDDTLNIIEIRLNQTTLNAAERAYCYAAGVAAI